VVKTVKVGQRPPLGGLVRPRSGRFALPHRCGLTKARLDLSGPPSICFVDQPIRCIEIEIIRSTVVALGCFDLILRDIEFHSAAGASFSGHGITQLCSLGVSNWTIGSCRNRCHQRQCT
jgi:hypothetical protein